MLYLGFNSHVVFDSEAGIFHGEVIYNGDIITFQAQHEDQAQHEEDLERELKLSVDEYVEFCKTLDTRSNKK